MNYCLGYDYLVKKIEIEREKNTRQVQINLTFFIYFELN